MSKTSRNKSVCPIAAERLAALNHGTVAATHLAECLAVDFSILMRASFPEIGEASMVILQQESKTGILKRMVLTGKLIHDRLGKAALAPMLTHPSDTVRGWA